MSARRTVLAVVLERDGAECRCAGGCGVEHAGRRCGAEPTEKAALIVAPYPLPLTEHETAAAPVSELRRQELDEAQMPLFDVESAGGGR
ncbi:hypothetical protein [Achromobacter spanius]|uniref:hypothetical protein n=1 Tax=Achromobacter spanius TaxID=217203 RepID=UPI003810DD0B